MKPNRRPCETIEVSETDENGISHSFIARVDFHPETGTPMGFFVASRGKEGSLLDKILFKMGVGVSRMMQHR
jgi:hypothetical protein